MKIMDALYAPFKIKETDFSQKNLMWLKIFGILAIPGPLAWTLLMNYTHSFVTAPVFLFIIAIPIVAMCACLFQRPINYLTRTDKKLDEWERGLKHRSESFAYRVMMLSALFSSALVLILAVLNPGVDFSLSLMDVAAILISFVMALFVIISNFLAWTIMPFSEGQDEEALMERETKVKNVILITAIIICCLAFFPALFGLGYMNAHIAAGH